MRIDSHQHFWRYDPGRDGWITDEMSLLRRDYMPEELIRQMHASAVKRSVAVQADQSEAETRFLLDLAGRHSEVAAVVGWIDLRAPNVEERLRELSRYKKLRGFRHIVQAEPDDRFLLGDDFLRGIGCLGKHGFTYDILIYPRHLAVAAEFVRRFPAQRFVLDHLAKPEIRAGEV